MNDIFLTAADNVTNGAYVQNNLFAKMALAYQDDPHCTALIDVDTNNEYSWAALDAMSARYANALEAKGIFQGDKVLAAVGKGVSSVALYLATIRMGAIHVPIEPLEIDPKDTKGDNLKKKMEEITFIERDLEPTLMVVNPELEQYVKGLNTPYEVLNTIQGKHPGSLALLAQQQNAASPIAAVAKDAMCELIYTSGTTGRGKGVIHTHYMLFENAISIAKHWGLTRNSKLYHALVNTHIHGLDVAQVPLFVGGGCIYFKPGKYSAPAMINHLQRYPEINSFMGVPGMYDGLVKAMLPMPQNERRRLFANMELCTIGSDIFEPYLRQQFKEYTGMDVSDGYGSTEQLRPIAKPKGMTGPNVGILLPNCHALILDEETGEDITNTVGRSGLLYTSSPYTTPGYYNRPQANKETFHVRDGRRWYCTSDIVNRNEDGSFNFEGRTLDFDKVNGNKVYAPKITDVIKQAMRDGQINEVIGIQTHLLGQRFLQEANPNRTPDSFGGRVVSIIVPKNSLSDGERQEIAGQIRAVCHFGVESYEHPRYVVFLDKMATTSVGKIARRELNNMCAQLIVLHETNGAVGVKPDGAEMIALSYRDAVPVSAATPVTPSAAARPGV